MNRDIQHLNILSLFHYLVGGLTILISSLFIFHLIFGLIALLSPASLGGTPPPPLFGWILTFLGALAVFFGWSLGIALMIAGRFLRRRTHYLYCMVMAGLSLTIQPFGTILGVFTLIVLLRPSVKRLFETGQTPYDPEEDEMEEFHDDRISSSSYNIHDER